MTTSKSFVSLAKFEYNRLAPQKLVDLSFWYKQNMIHALFIFIIGRIMQFWHLLGPANAIQYSILDFDTTNLNAFKLHVFKALSFAYYKYIHILPMSIGRLQIR